MAGKQSNERQLVVELAVLLGGGGKKDASPEAVTRDSLTNLTQKELVNASKRLGLVAVSKMKKEDLAVEVWDAWMALRDTASSFANGHGTSVSTGERAGTSVDAPASQGTAAASAEDAEGSGDTAPRSHKFEVGEAGRSASEQAVQLGRAAAREIPWGYGRDRVTAMAIDPDRFFAYWEVLDDSIARARTQLGRGGADAWLNLRVYDVTGRIFDGTNAHGNFDHRVERGDRQWFFPIGKPTSELIVEMGLKSDEGYFVKIARSSRVQFPRREPAPDAEPEWLTVRLASGQMERAGAGMPGRPVRPGGPAPLQTPVPVLVGRDGVPPRVDGAAGHMRRGPWNGTIPAGAQTAQWEQVNADGMLELHRQVRWESPAMESSWAAGPFPYPVEVPVPVREGFAGKTRVYRVGTQTHVVYGPWQVVIRGLGAEHSRSVLSRWEVYRSWGEQTGHEVEEFGSSYVTEGDVGGGSERMVGASGRRWVGSSELRFAGSSEQYFLKASEIRLGGSSERQLVGASEWTARGASERRLGGGSEWVAQGSSERLFAGGSDRWQRPGVPPTAQPVPVGSGPKPLVSSGAAPAPASAPMGSSAYPPPPSGAVTPEASTSWRKGS